MRIDPKYFNKFILGIGVMCTVLIAYFSISYFFNQQSKFVESLGDGKEFYETRFRISGSTSDSLSAGSYHGAYVLLDFWSPWANRSHTAHKHIYSWLNNYTGDNLIVLSASVKDSDANVMKYINETSYPFIFVDGTDVYQQRNIPGVPAYVLFAPDGSLIAVNVGFSGPKDLEFLEQIERSQGK